MTTLLVPLNRWDKTPIASWILTKVWYLEMENNSINFYQRNLHHKPVKYNPQWLLPCCLPKGYQKIPTQEIIIRNENTYNLRLKCTCLEELTTIYLIMPPLTVPRTGSCHVLYKSCISSCLWAWAHTSPAYFVTSGQSCEATTYRTSILEKAESNFQKGRWKTKLKEPKLRDGIIQLLLRGWSLLHFRGESHLHQILSLVYH